MNDSFAINPSIAEEIADQYKTALERELRTSTDSLDREMLERSLELDAGKLKVVLEACFFASFERVESRTHDFRVAIAPPKRAMSDSVVKRLSPEAFAQAYVFENSLDIDKLAKISPALATTNERIGVWFEGDEAKIWGFSETGITAAVQIRPFEPGQLGVFVPLCAGSRVVFAQPNASGGDHWRPLSG